MKRQPRVSIVLPVHNRERTLARAVESVLAQTHRDWELLIVEDGSTDGTPALAETFASRDPRIRVIRVAHRGVSAARNRGLERAGGQIITYLDSDNTWRPGFLAAVVARLEGRTRAACYAGIAIHTIDAADRTRATDTRLDDFDRERILIGNYIDLNVFAHSVDLYWDLGGFDESMTRLVDWDLILRYTAALRPEKISEVLADYSNREDPTRVSLKEGYAPNRLAIALKHRLGVAPVIIHVGPAPDAALSFWYERCGLEVQRVAKDASLFDGRTDRPIVVWAQSEWDDDAARFDRVTRRLQTVASLSFYVVPRSASVEAIAPRHRRFDFVVAGDEGEKQRLRRRLAEIAPLGSIDTTLLRNGPGGDELVRDLTRAARHHFPPANTTIGFQIAPDHPRRPQLEALVEAVRAHGFSCELGDGGSFPHDRSIAVIDGHTKIPADYAGLLALWLDDESEHTSTWLAVTRCAFTTSPAVAAELRDRYRGTRITELPTRADRAAHAFLAQLGALYAAPGSSAQPIAARPRLLYVHGVWTANTTRHRAFDPCKAVEAYFEVRKVQQDGFVERDIVGADVIVFQRWTSDTLAPSERAFRAIGKYRGLGKRFWYDIDDFVFHFGGGLPAKFMEACDGVFVGSEYLGELARSHNPNTLLLPNAIDVDLFRDVAPKKLQAGRRHVCVASTDGLGFEELRGIVDDVAAKVPNVTWHFVSALTDPPRYPNVEFHPIMPVEALFALIAGCDVALNLCTASRYLRERILANHDGVDDFLEAKSEVKFQLAGYAGTPLVSEPRPRALAKAISHGENGWLAGTKAELVDILVSLLQSDDERRRTATLAHRDVLDAHTLLARRPTYQRCYTAAWGPREPGLAFLRGDVWLAPQGAPEPTERDLRQLRALTFAITSPPHVVEPTLSESLRVVRGRIKKEALRVVTEPSSLLRLPGRVRGFFRRLGDDD